MVVVHWDPGAQLCARPDRRHDTEYHAAPLGLHRLTLVGLSHRPLRKSRVVTPNYSPVFASMEQVVNVCLRSFIEYAALLPVRQRHRDK